MATELASAYISLIPTLKGAGKTIGAALGGINMAPIGAKMGSNLTKGIGASMKAGLSDAIMAPVKKALESQATATSVLGQAEKDLTKQRAGQQSAQAKVAKAEEKLTSLRDSGKASSADLKVAEADLNTAKVTLSESNIKVSNSEEKLTTSKESATAANKVYVDSLKQSSTQSGRMATALPVIATEIERVGQNMRDAGGKISDVGSSLTKKLTVPAVTAATAIGGIVTALGFKRLIGIDTARGQFTGLGHDADQVMEQVDKGVTNTALSMADGAALAVGALATGNLPLKDLEDQIKRTANVSAAYGVESSHAGYLLNNVLTKNKVTYGDLSQMAQNQIPIISDLARHYGVTGDEIQTMAKNGEISIADFNTVLDKSAGKAAEEYGKTWKGVTSNIMSNLGKFGAQVWGDVFPKIKTELEDFLQVLKSPELKEFGVAIGEQIGKAFERLTNTIKGAISWWNGLSPAVQKMVGALAGVALAAGPVIFVIGKIVTGIGFMVSAFGVATSLLAGWKIASAGAAGGTAVLTGATKAQTIAMNLGATAQKLFNLAMKANPIVKIVSLVIALGAAFVLLWKNNETFRNFFIGAWNAIKTVVGTVGEFLGGVFSAIGDWVSKTLGPVFVWLRDTIVKPVFDAISGFIGAAGDKAGSVFGAISDFVRGTLGAVFVWLRDKVIQPVMTGIQAAISFAWNGVIKPVFDAMSWFVTGVLGPAFAWLRDFLNPLWITISAAVKIAWAIIETIFLVMKWMITDVLGPAFKWLWENVIKPTFSNIVTFISSSWTLIKTVFSVLVGYVRAVLGAIFTWLWEGIIKPTWTRISGFISTTWNAIRAVFTILIGYVRATLAAVFTWLYDYIIKPVWSGIKWYISTMWDGIKVIFNTIRDFIRNVLGPIFTWVYEKAIKPAWEKVSGVITSVWEKHIRPAFEKLRDFVQVTLPSAFEKAVKSIDKIWNGIRNIAAAPINFVIGTVYNNGLRKALNAVRKVVGGSPLDEIPGIPAFAKGGQMGSGWKLVGEEGPELINTSPGYVYTANETERMLAGKSQLPYDALNQKSNPVQAHEGIGGWMDSLKNAASGALSWVRGGLANLAEGILNPVKEGIKLMVPGGTEFGKTTHSALDSAMAATLKWIRGKDAEADPEGGGGGGSFGGSYSGALGRFYRPGGRITSGFGSSRGRYPHAGIDFAVPIGTAVKAMFDGVVRKTGWNAVTGRSGKGLVMGHANGMGSYYGHLNGWVAKPGQNVKAGETIARSGNTGRSTGPHLHAELWRNGQPFNFASYLHDSGGWHAPGTMSYNGLKKPEAILTPAQWDNISELAAQSSGSAGGDTYNIGNVGYDPAEIFQRARTEKRRAMIMARL